MPKLRVRPCIWLQHDAQSALDAYTALVPNSKVVHLQQVTDPAGNEVLTGEFVLGGVHYQLLGGPAPFEPNPSFSISIECRTQTEIDRYWDALLAGGEASQCGWLTDRWGLSWQIYPAELPQLLGDRNPARAAAAANAMFGMSKIVLADIRAAADAVAPAGDH